MKISKLIKHLEIRRRELEKIPPMGVDDIDKLVSVRREYEKISEKIAVLNGLQRVLDDNDTTMDNIVDWYQDYMNEKK